MGENKTGQQIEDTKADLKQTYGSQQEGRHNREGTSAISNENQDEELNNPSLKQQNRLNRQDQDSQEKEDDSYDYEKDEDQFEQGPFYTRSQMNEMQDDYLGARVEGDDKDILGETENSRRNEQYSKGEYNRGKTQNR